jgi:hypothetical protein
MPYEKDLIRTIATVIPCMHMPVLPMAIKTLKEFKNYLKTFEEDNLTVSDVINDVERYLKNAGAE